MFLRAVSVLTSVGKKRNTPKNSEPPSSTTESALLIHVWYREPTSCSVILPYRPTRIYHDRKPLPTNGTFFSWQLHVTDFQWSPTTRQCDLFAWAAFAPPEKIGALQNLPVIDSITQFVAGLCQIIPLAHTKQPAIPYRRYAA